MPENGEHSANITTIVNRLQPLVRRAVDNGGNGLTSLSEDDADGDTGAGSGAFQALKNILSAQYADAATAEMEIGTNIIVYCPTLCNARCTANVVITFETRHS